MANLIVKCDDGGTMGRLGRPTPDVVLSETEQETLVRWARRPKSAQALALRCRIVLACAAGHTNGEIAAELACNRTTVGKWRRRFADMRLDGLIDEPRPGRPRSLTDQDVERPGPTRNAQTRAVRHVFSECRPGTLRSRRRGTR